MAPASNQDLRIIGQSFLYGSAILLLLVEFADNRFFGLIRMVAPARLLKFISLFLFSLSVLILLYLP